MVSLLKSIALESLCYLWVSLAVGLTAHSEIHTYLSTLSNEVVLKALAYEIAICSLRNHICDAKLMLCNELQSSILFHLLEL